MCIRDSLYCVWLMYWCQVIFKNRYYSENENIPPVITANRETTVWEKPTGNRRSRRTGWKTQLWKRKSWETPESCHLNQSSGKKKNLNRKKKTEALLESVHNRHSRVGFHTWWFGELRGDLNRQKVRLPRVQKSVSSIEAVSYTHLDVYKRQV